VLTFYTLKAVFPFDFGKIFLARVYCIEPSIELLSISPFKIDQSLSILLIPKILKHMNVKGHL
jgi:hypothetical protein